MREDGGRNTREPVSGQESALSLLPGTFAKEEVLSQQFQKGKEIHVVPGLSFLEVIPCTDHHLHREKQNGTALGNHTLPYPVAPLLHPHGHVEAQLGRAHTKRAEARTRTPGQPSKGLWSQARMCREQMISRSQVNDPMGRNGCGFLVAATAQWSLTSARGGYVKAKNRDGGL